MASQEETCNYIHHQKVLITRTMAVHPNRCPPPLHEAKTIHLSNIDRKCPQLIYLVFFYRSSPPHISVFNSIKKGLEETLSAWYPAAGRLFINPHGKLDLLCNNSGALLSEAVTKVHISELEDLSQYNDFFEKLVPCLPFTGNFSEMPLVVAQVTRFGCGGYAVGVGTSHSLFDGQANFNFLKAWARKTAGRGNKEGESCCFEPVHDRGRLLVGYMGCEQDKKLEAEAGLRRNKVMLVTRVIAFNHLHQLIMQAAVDADYTPTSKKESYVLRTFSLSCANVDKLKREVAGSSMAYGSHCSSFEVVAAHLWKARTKALGIAKEKMVCLQFTVDIRNKMEPPLPQTFSGNAFVLCSVASTVGEILGIKLTTLVDKIKEAKLVVTEEYIQAYLKALDAPQGELPLLPELTMVSDWQRMPYHQLDFLGQSSAIYVSPLASPMQQAAFFMQKPGEVGGVDVRIGLPEYSVPAFTHHFMGAL